MIFFIDLKVLSVVVVVSIILFLMIKVCNKFIFKGKKLMTFVFSTLIIIILFLFAISIYNNYLKTVVYYKGAKVDNFNGISFIDLPNQILTPDDPAFKITRKSMLYRLFARTFSISKPKLDPKDIPPMEKSIPKDIVLGEDIEVYLINHSTVLIQTQGLNIITDPVYSNVAGPYSLIGVKRLHEPAIDINDLPKIDIILISHAHYDHMDLPTIKKLYKKFKPLIITPLGNDYFIKNLNKHINVITLNWGEKASYKGVDFYLHKAYHWSRRGLHDRNKALWGGFVISTNTKNIYFAGDTAFGDGEAFYEIMQTHKKIDLALLPIGAYKPNAWRRSHTNPQEAVEIFKRVNAVKALAIHTGTFELSFETYNDAKIDLDIALTDYKINKEDFITPIMGKMYKY